MIGSLIGGGASIAASVAGAVASASAAKKAQKNLRNRIAENRAWYDQRYNEDATQRADAQRAIARLDEMIKSRNKGAAGTSAVMGSTDAVTAMRNASNADALANTMSNIAVAGDRRKDSIERSYRATDNSLNDKINQAEMQRGTSIANAAQGAATAVGKIGTAYDELMEKQKTINKRNIYGI